MDYTKVAKKKISEFEVFLQHNINLGHITRETTIDELFMFLNNVRESYLPLQKEIDKLYERLMKGE